MKIKEQKPVDWAGVINDNMPDKGMKVQYPSRNPSRRDLRSQSKESAWRV